VAKKAISLSPYFARSYSVLGFTELMQANIDDAINYFQHAISIDANDPMAYMGLALANIRQGDLDKGIENLEIAASLKPNESLIRSYLGKAYDQKNQYKIASQQYELAKEADPKDPTPYFYDAIFKQTHNRPTEALQVMEKAIELNDNRAVYRSNLLLDQDVAARGASLARVYSDLGFEKLAYTEASKSLLHDPTNFSAHRFLADTYASQSLHEIARVSEVLQMQLWQPTSRALLQPQLNQTNLGILQAGGSQYASYREYNPLFMEDGFSFQVSGLVAGNDTYSNDAVLNYQRGKMGFSLGQYHYQTQGFRENSDSKQNLYNAIFQYNFTADTSIQAEYRHQNNDNGDLILHPYPDDTFRDKGNSDTWRIGLRHVFSPKSAMIMNFTKIDKFNHMAFFPFQTDSTAHAHSIELQHVYRVNNFDIITGTSYYRADETCQEQSEIPEITGPVSLCREEKFNVTNGKVYSYGTFHLPYDLFFTAGLSVNYLKNLYMDDATVNPKLGLTWQPSSKTTVRAAAFKTTKHSLINQQTIEPTQVVGFNQFFDELDGTQAWRVGVGMDQALTESMRIGYEWSQRILEQPSTVSDNIEGNLFDTKSVFHQNFHRAYWNYIIYEGLVSSLDYEFSDLATLEARKLTTHKLPFNLAYFHKTGLSINVKTTYFNQSGLFFTPMLDMQEKKSSFVTVDLGLSYRLPNRYGKITLGVLNVLDEKFEYTDFDAKRPILFPERVLYSNVTLSFQ